MTSIPFLLWIRGSWATSVSILAVVTIWTQGIQRETARQVLPSGKITGIVVLSDDPDQLVADAAVTLTSTDPVIARREITNERGEFSFDQLPHGKFTIDVTKAGYVSGKYGARAPGQLGTRLALDAIDNVQTIRLMLFRGAVIAGTVIDESGVPVDGARIILSRHVNAPQGLPIVVQSWLRTSDDQGHYRFFSLPPGDFSATAFPPDSANVDPPILRLATGEVQRTIDTARMPNSLSKAPVRYASEAQTFGYLPAVIQPLHVALGEQLLTVDFRMSRGLLTTITGVVTTSAGEPVPSVRVTVRPAPGSHLSPASQRSARTNEVGEYRVSDLLPSSYVVTASSPPSGPSPSRFGAATVEAASGTTHVPLVLRPGATVFGRIDSSSAADRVRIAEVALGLLLFNAAGEATNPPKVLSPADNTFQFYDLAPGRYRLNYSAVTANPWFLEGATSGSGSLLEPPFLELKAGDVIKDVVVTFTERPTEVRGVLFDRTDQPSSEYSILLFPSDSTLWGIPSYRIRETVPASNGSFSVKGLPPGQYLLAARAVEGRLPITTQLLAEALAASVPVSLGAGQVVVKDLKVR